MKHSGPTRGRRKVLMRLARLGNTVELESSRQYTDDRGNGEG